MTDDGGVDDDARLDRRIEARPKTDRREMLGAAARVALGGHAPPRADLRGEVLRERRLALLAQPPRALLDDLAAQLRHARRRRAGARRKWKHVQEGQPAGVDEVERAREHRLVLGRETRDDIAAE